MTNTIPTIEDLIGKPKGELQTIFRKASAIADSTDAPKPDRDAARKTLDNLQKALNPAAPGHQ